MKRRGIGYRPALFVLTAVFGLGPCFAAHAFEVTDQQREACEPDAFRLCSNEIPDIPRVTACMTANKARLSAPCRAVFDSMANANAPARQVHAEAQAEDHARAERQARAERRAQQREEDEDEAEWHPKKHKKEAIRHHKKHEEEAVVHHRRAHHKEVIARRYRHHYYADYDR
jgi:hypothetical protein